MKTEACFEIRAYIKDRVNPNTPGSQKYNELCLIHWTSAVYKSLVFRWYKKFQDGPNPGQSETVVTNAKIAAVTGLIKRDARCTVKTIAHSVEISSGSVQKIYTEQLKLRRKGGASSLSLAWPTIAQLEVFLSSDYL